MAGMHTNGPDYTTSDVYISQEHLGICSLCRNYTDLRMGFCFECATDGERRAAQRSVAGHLARSFVCLWRGHWESARICRAWAWERLTRTGDYAPGGTFEREYGKF